MGLVWISPLDFMTGGRGGTLHMFTQKCTLLRPKQIDTEQRHSMEQTKDIASHGKADTGTWLKWVIILLWIHVSL